MRPLVPIAIAIASLSLSCGRPPPPPPDPTTPARDARPEPAEDAAAPAAPASTKAAAPTAGRGPGFAEQSPWLSFYGTAAQMGDLKKVAATFRIVNLEADPALHTFTDAQIKTLRAGGKNKVIGYLNLGACEKWRVYWNTAPAGIVPCGKNKAAQIGPYSGFPDEVWMDPGEPAYQKLIVEHVAARIAARGVDGFFLDNVELLEHGSGVANGPCGAPCAQGGLDLIRLLRAKYPDMLIVQNGPNATTRKGVTGDVPYPTLIDGVVQESVYTPEPNADAERELLAWKALGLKSRDGHPFFIGVLDYAGSCKNVSVAKAAMAKAKAQGFVPAVSDSSSGLHVVCYW